MRNTTRSIKIPMLLITYGILLFLLVSHLDIVFYYIGTAFKILSPFFLGIAVAYTLNLLMRLYENKVFAFFGRLKRPIWKKVLRPVSLTATFLTVILILLGIGFFIIPQLGESIALLSGSIKPEVVEKYIQSIMSQYGLTGDWWEDLAFNWEEIFSKTGQFVSTVVPQIYQFTLTFTNGLISLIMGIIISVYLLASKEKLLRIMKKLIYAFLPLKGADWIMSVGTQTNKAVSGFITGQVTEAAILGVLCFIGMMIFQMPYALLISVLIGLTSLIPIFGAFIGTVPGAFIILMVDPGKTLWFVLFIIILQQVEGNLIYPRVVGGNIGLDGLWVLVALMVGGSLFGIPGILIGIPAFAVFYALLKRYTHKRLEEKDLTIE